ncbi:hypothetical protein T492DRAFT_956944 [Pavlovales sp. CCMP2436]|nr:hypothetical protein T492DRAFT_956944 [Pavlovales sp. CCMP2436]
MAPAVPAKGAAPTTMPTTREMIKMPANTFAIPAISMARQRWAAGGGQQRLTNILRAPGNGSALRKLIVTTTAMLTLPLAAMVLCYYYLLDQLFTLRGPNQKMMYSGVAGLLVTQLVSIWFVVSAFNEPDEEEEEAPAAERPHVD